jgi:hypothetical protein
MAPIFELRPLLAWSGFANFVRLSYAAAAKVARWLWPPVNTVIGAQYAAFYGFLACLAIGGNLFGTDTLLASRLPSEFATMAPVLHIGLALGWFLAGIAILRYSRLGAIAALAAYIACGGDNLVTENHLLHPGAVGITILIVLMLTGAIRGVFAHHQMSGYRRDARISPRAQFP